MLQYLCKFHGLQFFNTERRLYQQAVRRCSDVAERTFFIGYRVAVLSVLLNCAIMGRFIRICFCRPSNCSVCVGYKIPRHFEYDTTEEVVWEIHRLPRIFWFAKYVHSSRRADPGVRRCISIVFPYLYDLRLCTFFGELRGAREAR